MQWIYLILAGAGEIIGVAAINQWNRNKNSKNMTMIVTGFIFSFLFLSLAMKTIPMGTAYAIWTGIGTVGSTLLGMLVFGESKDMRRIACISVVICAAVGLKLIA